MMVQILLILVSAGNNTLTDGQTRYNLQKRLFPVNLHNPSTSRGITQKKKSKEYTQDLIL